MSYVLYMYLYQACAAGCWASIGLHAGHLEGGGGGVHDSLKNTSKKISMVMFQPDTSAPEFCISVSVYLCTAVSLYLCISASLYLFISLSLYPVLLYRCLWSTEVSSAKVPPWRGKGGVGGGGGALPSRKDLLPPIVYSVESLVPGRLPGSLPADHVFGELSPAAFPVSSFRSGRSSLNCGIAQCLKSL